MNAPASGSGRIIVTATAGIGTSAIAEMGTDVCAVPHFSGLYYGRQDAEAAGACIDKVHYVDCLGRLGNAIRQERARVLVLGLVETRLCFTSVKIARFMATNTGVNVILGAARPHASAHVSLDVYRIDCEAIDLLQTYHALEKKDVLHSLLMQARAVMAHIKVPAAA